MQFWCTQMGSVTPTPCAPTTCKTSQIFHRPEDRRQRVHLRFPFSYGPSSLSLSLSPLSNFGRGAEGHLGACASYENQRNSVECLARKGSPEAFFLLFPILSSPTAIVSQFASLLRGGGIACFCSLLQNPRTLLSKTRGLSFSATC